MSCCINLDVVGASMSRDTRDEESKSEGEVGGDYKKRVDKIVSETAYDSGFLNVCTSVWSKDGFVPP